MIYAPSVLSILSLLKEDPPDNIAWLLIKKIAVPAEIAGSGIGLILLLVSLFIL